MRDASRTQRARARFDAVVGAVRQRLPAGLRRRVPASFVGFALINVLTFSVDLTVLWILYRRIGLANPLAVTFGYAAGFGLAFVLNRWLTFDARRAVGPQLVRYLGALLVNYLVVILGIGSGLIAAGAPFWSARLVAGLVEAGWMYAALRWWVFRDRPVSRRRR